MARAPTTEFQQRTISLLSLASQGLAGVAISSFAAAIFMLPPSVVTLGAFGMPSMPIWWFVAVAAVVAGSALQWLLGGENSSLALIRFGVFLGCVWLFPQLAGVIPRAGQGWQYTFWGQVLFVAKHGTIDASSWIGHNWPAPAMVWTILSKVVGESDPRFFVANATWTTKIAAVLLATGLVLRPLLHSRKMIWASAYVLTVGLWSPQLGISMQALGFLLYLTLLGIVLSRRHRPPASSWHLSFSLVAGALMLTHLLSALWGLLSISALLLFEAKRGHSRNIEWATMMILFGAWAMYVGDAFVRSTLRYVLDRVLSWSFFLDFVSQVYGSPSSSEWRHTIAAKTALTLTIGAMSFVGVAVSVTRREERAKNVPLIAASGLMVFALFLVGPSYTPTPSLRWEVFHRLTLFLLPLMAYFAVGLVASSRWYALIALVLLLSSPISYVANFAPDFYSYVSNQAVAKYRFVGGHYKGGVVNELSGAMPGFEETQYVYGLSSEYMAKRRITLGGLSTLVLLGDQENRVARHMFGSPTGVSDLEVGLARNPKWAQIYTGGIEHVWWSRD